MGTQSVDGGIVVHSRTQLYDFGVGAETASFVSVDGTYTGDLDGPATEVVVTVEHADGSRTHYGFGAFTGSVLGRPGTLTWRFTGVPGRGDIDILSGTGELEGVTGTVAYWVNEGSTTEFTYAGTLDL